MTFDHTPIAAVASGILAQFGRSVTIRKATAGSSNPVTGTVTPGTPVEVTANAYFDQVNNFKVDPTLVQAGDRVVYIDAEPSVGNEIIRDGEVWEVISVTPYELGAGVAAWEALVRK